MKPLLLEKFLPYRLSYLSNIISGKLAKLYAQDFQIAPQEWRVMAILNRFPDSSAASVCERTALDKVAVSRALKSLNEKSLINRHFCKDDRRKSILSLSDQGLSLYRQIEPLASAYETTIISILDEKEREQLDHLIGKLTQHALTP